jgi:hypothetical protein
MQQQAMHSMHDPELHTPFLRHPSISQDQQAVVQLQQVSKELQAAVAQLLAGQVPVALDVQHDKMQQAFTLVQWLQKHAGLLRSLDLQLPRSARRLEGTCAAIASQLGDALQQAAAASGPLQLLSMSLQGSAVGSGLLQSLPAARLSRLEASLDLRSSASMQAVAALSGLHCLQLSSSDTAAAPDDALAPLSALQQLTQLHVGTVRPRQLQWVPASVQQLHLRVSRMNAQQIQQLADWLRQRAHIVSTLTLDLVQRGYIGDWRSAMDSLVAAFGTAAAATSATAEASASAAGAAAGPRQAASSISWQLQELSMSSRYDECVGGRVVQQLPAGTLWQLACSFNWSNAAHISAMCTHTGLSSLSLVGSSGWGRAGLAAQATDALAPLSVLQQLTQLNLDVVRREQLQHLQLPQLQDLRLRLLKSEAEHPRPFRLDQLTTLHVLRIEAGNGLQRADHLPPNLCQLSWLGWVKSSTAGIQPLLALSRLRKLIIVCEDVSAAAGEEAALVSQEMVQLSTLDSLQELVLVMDTDLTADAAAVAAWHVLPLRRLHLRSSGVIEAGVLQGLRQLEGLTSLSLRNHPSGAGSLAATHEQLGVVLQQLTRLQQLTLQALRVDLRGASSGDYREPYHDVEGVAVLLQAICDLHELKSVQIELPVPIDDAAVQLLSTRFAASLLASVEQLQVKPDKVVMLSYGVDEGAV